MDSTRVNLSTCDVCSSYRLIHYLYMSFYLFLLLYILSVYCESLSCCLWTHVFSFKYGKTDISGL